MTVFLEAQTSGTSNLYPVTLLFLLHLKAVTSTRVLTVFNNYLEVLKLNDCNLQPAPLGEGSVQNQWWWK